MKWMTHALMASFVCAAGWSCGPRTARPQTEEPKSPPPIASTRPAAKPDVDPPTTSPDPCPSLQPNEVSDDETPSIAGTAGRIKAGEWLEARGVSKSAFRSWVRSRDPKNFEDFDADSIFDADDSCQTLTVGDEKEDALICALAVRTSIMRFSAVAFVVRSKRIVPVLDVGYALPAMDWPDSRWLDLQLTFSRDGLEADLHDRAKPGTVLVRSPNACREHAAQSPMGGDRVELRGCAEALPKLDELVRQSGAGDPYAAEFRSDRAFAVKSCEARGRYVWKGDRFVRSP